MNAPREKDCFSSAREHPSRIEGDPDRLTRPEDDLAQGLEAALASEDVDLKDLVRHLVCRLSASKCRLARIDRWKDRMDRRVSQAESRLAGQASRVSKQEEALRMICSILKDLDDPYGFGLSLDERLACDGADRIPEEEG